MLKVSGVATSVRNGWKASLKSSQRTRATAPHMSAPNENERRRSRVSGDGSDQPCAEHGHEEQHGDNQIAESGTRARRDTGGALDVTSDRRRKGKRDRVVRPQPHDDRGDRRRNACGEENAIDGHAPFRENLRVDDHNIRHGHERGQPREQFAPHRGLVFVKVKDALKQAEFSGIKRAPL